MPTARKLALQFKVIFVLNSGQRPFFFPNQSHFSLQFLSPHFPILTSLFLTLTSVFLSCKNSSPTEHHHEIVKPGSPAPETLAMIDSVQKAQAAVDPMKVTVFMSAQ